MNKKRLALVDFDKTLIHIDSFTYLMKAEHWYLYPDVLFCGIGIIWKQLLHRNSLSERSRFKYQLLLHFQRFPNEKKERYIAFFKSQLNVNVIKQIRFENYDKIVVASASEKSLIRLVISEILDVDDIIANDVEALPDSSSEFVTCWGEEKCRRFIAAWPDYKKYSITVFTDSDDDKSIMKLAENVIMVEG